MTEETNVEGIAPADDLLLAAEQPQEQPQTGDDVAAPAEQPRKQTAQERIDEVTRLRREAERQADEARRDAEYWREQALRAAPRPEPQAQPQGDNRPDPNAYDYGATDERYIEDLTAWKAEQVLERRLTERDQNRQVQTARTTFDAKAAELYPDGEPAGLIAIRRAPTLPPAVQEILLSSEIGPKLADHLGSEPRELQRISALSPAMQARELTKLEARLTAPPAQTPKTATDAPAPPPQVRGAGGRFGVAADTTDFTAFEKQYLGG